MEKVSFDRCPFCRLDASRIIGENSLAVAIFDLHPVSLGHALVIPKRHAKSFFDLTSGEVAAINELLRILREKIQDLYKPDGCNIGVNDGEAAGQTVMHFHCHLIPRYVGDVSKPRGGIRNVIPGKGDYS